MFKANGSLGLIRMLKGCTPSEMPNALQMGAFLQSSTCKAKHSKHSAPWNFISFRYWVSHVT